jgi:hypothetical protein
LQLKYVFSPNYIYIISDGDSSAVKFRTLVSAVMGSSWQNFDGKFPHKIVHKIIKKELTEKYYRVKKQLKKLKKKKRKIEKKIIF